jgi:hypothetical protein
MKRICVLVALLFACGEAFSQSSAFNGYCSLGGTSAITQSLNSTNKLLGIINGCTVTVYITGTLTKATLTSDGSTVLSNPFTANLANAVNPGAYIFYASPGVGYDVVMSGGGGNPSCVTAPLCYTAPVTIKGVSVGSRNALAFGCIPNSTATADEASNVTCIQTMGNTPGRYVFPAGQFNLNSCANITANGGFIFEGAGPSATSVVQQTSATCAIKITAMFPNQFRISDMTISHAVAQTPPASESVNSLAPALFFTGPAGAATFNFELSRLGFNNSSRGMELDKTIGGTIWGYRIEDITCNGNMQGACINFSGTGAGNPRPYIHKVYNTAILTTEPVISISQGQQVDINDIEDTPNSLPNPSTTHPWPTSFDFSGSSDGNVTNIHIENRTVADSGNRLIAAENGNLLFSNIFASVILCPTGYTCNGFGSVSMDLVSNVAGGGSIRLRNATINASGSGNANGSIYVMKYGTNPTEAQCDGLRSDAIPSTYVIGCIDPGSGDLGLATKNNTQYADATLNNSSSVFTLTSVASPSSGTQVYTGTITGCAANACSGDWFLIAGFTTSGNNGFYLANASTATTLTLVNTAGGAETHAATATQAVVSVAHNIYERYNNSGSALANWAYRSVPVWNPVSNAWDSYLSLSNVGMMTGGQSFFMPGFMHIWTRNNPNLSPANQGTTGYMRLWTRDNTNNAVPAITLGRNNGAGSQWVNTDIRGIEDGSGFAEFAACMQTNLGQAIGSETMPTDTNCQLKVDHSGNLFLGAASCTSGTFVKGDGTGCGLPTGTGIANVTISIGSFAIPANTCYGSTGSTTPATVTQTGVTTSSRISPGFTGNPSAITGWGTAGGLNLAVWPSAANTDSYLVCNSTSGSITGGAITFVLGAQ